MSGCANRRGRSFLSSALSSQLSAFSQTFTATYVNDAGTKFLSLATRSLSPWSREKASELAIKAQYQVPNTCLCSPLRWKVFWLNA